MADIKTFPNFKDYLLIALIGYIAYTVKETQSIVARLDKQTVATEYQIRELSTNANKSEEKNKEQDERISRIEAVIRDEDIRNLKKLYQKKSD